MKRRARLPREGVRAMRNRGVARRVTVMENPGLRRQPVQVRRPDPVVAVCADVIVAQRIDSDNNNVFNSQSYSEREYNFATHPVASAAWSYTNITDIQEFGTKHVSGSGTGGNFTRVYLRITFFDFERCPPAMILSAQFCPALNFVRLSILRAADFARR